MAELAKLPSNGALLDFTLTDRIIGSFHLPPVLLFFFTTLLYAGPVHAVPIAEVFAVWAVPAADRKTVIKYAWIENDQWTVPAVLPVDSGLHVTPVIVPGNDNSVWIIWIEQTADENILRYAAIRQGSIIVGRVQEGPGEQSFAPNVLRDRDGTIWVTWSGVVNRLADVFTTQLHGNSWEKPQRVNQSNKFPDITPIIGIDRGGTVWVSWFSFTVDHRFVQYMADYRDKQWIVRSDPLPEPEMKNFVEKRSSRTIELPVGFQDRIMGAVFNASGKAPIQSVSDHFRSARSPRRQ